MPPGTSHEARSPWCFPSLQTRGWPKRLHAQSLASSGDMCNRSATEPGSVKRLFQRKSFTVSGAGDGIRTRDRRFRKPLLYPTKLPPRRGDAEDAVGWGGLANPKRTWRRFGASTGLRGFRTTAAKQAAVRGTTGPGALHWARPSRLAPCAERYKRMGPSTLRWRLRRAVGLAPEPGGEQQRSLPRVVVVTGGSRIRQCVSGGYSCPAARRCRAGPRCPWRSRG